jgi:hypothetical protein
VAQAGALLLSFGVSEIALSKILSGMLGLVSFQALAIVVYALSRNSLLAVGSVFVIFVTRAVDYGAVHYPVQPPEEARYGSVVPKNANRVVWEARSREQWQHIGREYGVSQVITPSNWRLDLPVIAQSPEFELYTIPH